MTFWLRMCSLCTAVLSSLFVTPAFSQEKETAQVEAHGFTYFQIGQIGHTYQNNIDNHQFKQRANARLQLRAVLNDYVEVRGALEGQLEKNANRSQGDNSGVGLKEAQGILTYSHKDMASFRLSTGYFTFKYDPYATHLGEYLFRSGTYTRFLINNFDYAASRLLGFAGGIDLWDGTATCDMVLHSHIINPFDPFYDYSLSLLVGSNPIEAVDIGIGIQWYRLMPIMEELTTNKLTTPAKVENGDTLYWTKKGTKLMTRAAFDIKGVLGDVDSSLTHTIFGKSGGVLYSELAILGFRDYPDYYTKLSRRMPVMAGIHVPTHPFIANGILEGFAILGYLQGEDTFTAWDNKFEIPSHLISVIALPIWAGISWSTEHFFNIDSRWDLLAMEIEWYGAEYTQKSSVPADSKDDFVKEDDICWAVYAKKELLNGVAIKALLANDHYRDKDIAGNYQQNEIVRAANDWRYVLRLQYSF